MNLKPTVLWWCNSDYMRHSALRRAFNAQKIKAISQTLREKNEMKDKEHTCSIQGTYPMPRRWQIIQWKQAFFSHVPLTLEHRLPYYVRMWADAVLVCWPCSESWARGLFRLHSASPGPPTHWPWQLQGDAPWDTQRCDSSGLEMLTTARQRFQNGLLLPPSKLLPLLEQNLNGYSGNSDCRNLRVWFSSLCSNASGCWASCRTWKCRKPSTASQPWVGKTSQLLRHWQCLGCLLPALNEDKMLGSKMGISHSNELNLLQHKMFQKAIRFFSSTHVEGYFCSQENSFQVCIWACT